MVHVARFERFIVKVAVAESGCWLWKASRFGKGYGQFWWSAEEGTIGAHVAAWRLLVGAVPEGENVLHDCDNPPCVRPSHLFTGTTSDNLRDAIAKGRHRAPAPRLGRAHHNAKLTPQDVRDMRALAAQGVKAGRIAKLFGVNSKTAYNAINHITWRTI